MLISCESTTQLICAFVFGICKNDVFSFCLFGLRLNVPVNNFSVMLGWFPGFWFNQYKAMGIKCLAQGHNTPQRLRFEPVTLRSESDALPTELSVLTRFSHDMTHMCRAGLSMVLCLHVEVLCQFVFEPRREKTGFCICENKDADQLRGNREADQLLCFRYTDSTIPLLSKSEIPKL